MSNPIKQCPNCKNYVEGQRKQSLSKIGTHAILGNLFSSIVGKISDLAFDAMTNAVYEYECPNCGHTWEDDGKYHLSEISNLEHEEIPLSNIKVKSVKGEYVFFVNGTRFNGIGYSRDGLFKLRIVNGEEVGMFLYYSKDKITCMGGDGELKFYDEKGNMLSEDEVDMLPSNHILYKLLNDDDFFDEILEKYYREMQLEDTRY